MCRKEASGKRHRSRSKDSAGHNASKSRKKDRPESRHDWGIATAMSPPEVKPAPVREEQALTVPASEVPDALRARIKAMLARS